MPVVIKTEPTPVLPPKQQARLEDYVSDKLQTLADFDTLDALLDNVRNQQDLLRKQLEQADRSLEDADNGYMDHCTHLRQSARAFEQQQADIDIRLRIVTQSETSDEAVALLDGVMDQLHKINVADGYLSLLQDMESLREQALTQLKTDPNASIDAHSRLRSLRTTLAALQDDAEGAAPHLIDYLDKLTDEVRKTIEDALAKDLQATLAKFLWPKPNVTIPESIRIEFEKAFGKLLDFQLPDLQAAHASRPLNSTVLLPLQVMAQPFEERFHFHFSGKKPTNRLDKPEYFLSHIIDLITTYAPFVTTFVQPVLLKHLQGTSLIHDAGCVDATSALITSILPMLRTKIYAVLSQVAPDPRLLSHLMHEIMAFDSTLREDWRYGVSAPGNEQQWKGISWDILTGKDWFGRWLQVEKEFALARYQTIVDDKDSGTLDFESLDSTATKPTKAAIRVNDLLETITERYRPLASFSQKLSFLMDIQISIFDQFHARLQSALEVFLSRTSTIGRTVQGVSVEDSAKLKGVQGLDSLCRIFGSADYLERAMSDWSDDVFFLALWNELQQRAEASTGVSGARSPAYVSRHLSVSAVASKTSNTLDSRDDLDSVDAASGALFDETAAAYARVRARAEVALLETITSSLRESLRPYARSSQWSALSSPGTDADAEAQTPTTSVDLNPALDTLTSHLAFLARALGTLPLRRLGRQVARNLDVYIFDSVLMGNSFSLHSALQVGVDVGAIAAAMDHLVAGTVGARGLKRCLEACELLALPVKTVSDGTRAPSEGQGLRGSGLLDLQTRLAGADDVAADALAERGLVMLSVSEARQLLRRRLEVAG